MYKYLTPVIMLIWCVSISAQSLDQTYIAYYNPLNNGIACDSVTLNAAITAIGSAEKTLYLTATNRNKMACTWTINSSVTVPANIRFMVPYGVRATISAGITLDIQGCIDADDENWYSGGGIVTVSESCVSQASPSVGAKTGDYVEEGCLHDVSPNISVSIASCTVWLHTEAPTSSFNVYSEPDPVTFSYSGVDGNYYLAFRANKSGLVPGWTCVTGTSYCFILSSTRPTPPLGVMVIGRTTILGGAVTAFVSEADRKITSPITLPFNVTTGDGEWEWIGDRALLTVPNGMRLILGMCPKASRRNIIVAKEDGVSGSLRFGAGACGLVYPEWFGADRTGRVDSTAAWNNTIRIVAGYEVEENIYERIPISCEGSYRIEGTITLRQRTNIVGRLKTSASGTKVVSCEFLYYGNGTLFDGPLLPDGKSYVDTDFRHMRMYDSGGVGKRAFNMVVPSGMTMENLFTEGFDVPWFFYGSMIYGSTQGLLSRFYRERCMEVTGPANFARIEIICGAGTSTVIHGVRIGVEPGWFASSTNLKLRASVEASSGIPIILSELKGVSAELYVEQPGQCADYSGQGAIYLQKMEGGEINLTATGNCQPVGTGLPVGLRLHAITGLPGEVNPGVNNVAITGRIHSNYNVPVLIEPGPAMWGNDVTGLEFPLATSSIGNFTTGLMLGGSYMTAGTAPFVDEGMGSTGQGTVWGVGSMIWNQGGANESANYYYQVVEAGNPPRVARIITPASSGLTALGTEATPSVRDGNTFHNRMMIPTGVDITNFSNGLLGLCVNFFATGTRIIKHNTNIRLRTGVDYSMVNGNTLTLCSEGLASPWKEIGRCDTCIP